MSTATETAPAARKPRTRKFFNTKKEQRHVASLIRRNGLTATKAILADPDAENSGRNVNIFPDPIVLGSLQPLVTIKKEYDVTYVAEFRGRPELTVEVETDAE